MIIYYGKIKARMLGSEKYMQREPFKSMDASYLNLVEFTRLNKDLVAGFSSKNGGFSIDSFDSLNLGLHVQDQKDVVVKNRNLLAKKINIPLDQWVFADQVHGNMIKKITRTHCGKGTKTVEDAIKATDGMYTKESDVLLASLYADCVPLYFYDKKK